MHESEIALAKAYLAASGNDPVGALIRSVKDLALLRRQVEAGTTLRPRLRLVSDEVGMPAAA